MEKFEEKIIDLVDVIAEPEMDRSKGTFLTAVAAPEIKPAEEISHNTLVALVRKEVERLLRETIDENIREIIKPILVQEVEKAIAREIEGLKKT